MLVLSGDVPLLQPSTLDALATAAEAGWGAMTVAELPDPGSLGRVIVDPGGRLPGGSSSSRTRLPSSAPSG